MSGNGTPITIVGNLTADPELRFTPSGAAVANWTTAVNRRRFDRQANEWRDEGTDFYRCSAWRELAENVAESLTKGTEVVVVGSIATRDYETREGEKRTVFEVQAEHVGPSLRRQTARVEKAQRGQGGGGFGGGGQRPAAAPQDDPWATPAGGASRYSDEPPF
jgi:single-strand DNA-binding protein